MTMYALEEQDWPALHRLMVAQKFPRVPQPYAEAEPYFKGVHAYGVGPRRRTLEAAFVFGPPEDGIAFFDAVCAPTQHGKWATPTLLRQLFAKAFGGRPLGLGLRALWVQPHGARALKAALQAGFVAVTPLKGEGPPVLVITPALVPPSLTTHISTKENHHG